MTKQYIGLVAVIAVVLLALFALTQRRNTDHEGPPLIAIDFVQFDLDAREVQSDAERLQAFKRQWLGKWVLFDAYVMEAVPDPEPNATGGCYLIAPAPNTDRGSWHYAYPKPRLFKADVAFKSRASIGGLIHDISADGATFDRCVVGFYPPPVPLPDPMPEPIPPVVEPGEEVPANQVTQLEKVSL